MKITDATWEQRNLGVTCYEITFERDDKLSDVAGSWDKFLERQYLVLKVPNYRPDIAAFVQAQGAKYIETAITFKCDLRTWQLPASLKDICGLSSYAPMNDDDVQVMLAEIRKGIFKTDRIYLDSYFTHEQAAQRYVNWATDMLNRGHVAYKVMYRGEAVGFFNDALAGVYSKFTGTGMGLFVQYSTLDAAARYTKQPKVEAVVSSNNPEVVNIRIKLGCLIGKMNSVFVKHND